MKTFEEWLKMKKESTTTADIASMPMPVQFSDKKKSDKNPKVGLPLPKKKN